MVRVEIGRCAVLVRHEWSDKQQRVTSLLLACERLLDNAPFGDDAVVNRCNRKLVDVRVLDWYTKSERKLGYIRRYVPRRGALEMASFCAGGLRTGAMDLKTAVGPGGDGTTARRSVCTRQHRRSLHLLYVAVISACL